MEALAEGQDFWIPEVSGVIAGVLTLRPNFIDKLFLAPQWQGLGIGSALIKAAIDRARNESWGAIFVLGDRAYYERFGFDANAAAGFTSPYAGEHFMMLKLSPVLMAASGALRHAPAFAEVD